MMNLPTFNAETIRVLDLEEMALVSGGRTVDLRAPDPTNPQCPGPRWHPDFTKEFAEFLTLDAPFRR